VTARSAKVREALAWLERRGSKRIREEMLTRYGITAPKAFGMSVSAIQQLAKRMGRDHDLAASDERNFVKKGVSWALRAVGRRDQALNAAAVEVARRLSESPEAAPRWIGKDALRELTSPAVRRRLAGRRSAVEA